MTDSRVAELLERGREIGDELTRLGIELFQLGEVHEARHILAALRAGNTAECDETCPLRYANSLSPQPHTHTRWEDVKAARSEVYDVNDQRQHMDCMLGDCLVARTLGNPDIPCPHNMPEKTPEMIASGHQVWVWLQRPGRWEVRGTGVVLGGDD